PRCRRAGRCGRARSPERVSAEGFIVIAALAGTLSEKSPERLVVDVGGVGYALHASLRTFLDLPAAGEPVRLLGHTEVRERAVERAAAPAAPLEEVIRAALKGLGAGLGA